MLAKYLFPALAAAGLTQANICTQQTVTINSQADASALASCKSVKGSIIINQVSDKSIDLSGPESVEGDVVATSNGLESLQSDSLTSIGGLFKLNNLTHLSILSFQKLNSVKNIEWATLTTLNSMTVSSTGIEDAQSVLIADTRLDTLDGLNLSSVGSIDINNNPRLRKFSSNLKNLNQFMNIQANGLNLTISMPDLVWIANMTVANVTEFDVPKLETVNGSMRFDSNYMQSFSAPNLRSTTSGDISFVSNSALKNISCPSLTSVGGGLTIANNTDLQELDGFPKLKDIGGAIKLRGSFSSLSLPALNDVKGAFDVSSTADIKSACDKFKSLAPSSQGGEGQVQGKFSCVSNDANSNNDTSPANGSSGNDKNNAASSLGSSIASVFTIGVIVSFIQMFL